MAKVEGNLSDPARLLIYDVQLGALVINEARQAGAFSYTGLSSNEKIIIATRDSDGKSLAHGKVIPEGEDPVDVSYNIVSSGNDGYGRTDGSGWYNTQTYIEAGSIMKGMFRFTGVMVDQGAQINSAFLRFVANNGLGNDSCVLKVHPSDSAVIPSSGGDFAAKYGQLVGGVTWNTPASWPQGTVQDTPDISSLVQTIIDRPGWAPGNAIMFGFADPVVSQIRVASFDHATYNQPELHITYTA